MWKKSFGEFGPDLKLFSIQPWQQIAIQCASHHQSLEKFLLKTLQLEDTMVRTVRMAAFIVAATLVLSALALAHDWDDYDRRGNPARAQQYGYNNGFRDGAHRGQHEGRENDPFDYQTPDWRQATRGYKGSMGPVEFYQRGYQQGYEEGFRSGFEGVSRSWGRGDHDGDGHYASGGYGWHGGYEDGQTVAYQWGYQDGMDAARGDISRGKPYNPRPRGKYDDRDRGYRREFGSKDVYKAEYSDAYHRGYDEVMNGRGY
jgi:hypothetical protein